MKCPSVLTILVFLYLLATVQEHNSDFKIRVISPSDVDILTSEELKRICALSAVCEHSDSATVGVVQLISVVSSALCACVCVFVCDIDTLHDVELINSG